MTAANVAMRLSYKAHSSAAIVPGTEPTFASDPGAASAQELRRVGSTLQLVKGNFKSAEIASHQQVYDFRHGGKRVTGDVTGELSPKTYQDLMAAVVQGTWAAAVSKSNSDFTSVTISSGVATVGGSTWAGQNFKVGDVLRFGNLSVAANNGIDTTITALSGTAATLYPAPADNATDSAFTVATTGRKLQPPASSLVSAKFAFEHYYSDVDLSHLFTECRVGSMKVSMPAEGIATVSFGIIGRNMTPYTTGTSPFFTSPTAPVATSLLTSVGGQLLMSGSAVAIVTAAELMLDRNLSAPQVAFSPLVPEIYTGQLDVTGTLTVLFLDNTLVSGFINETEFELSLSLATSASASADYISFFMPRVKLNGAAFNNSGQAGVPITIPFRALKKDTTTGYDATTITIQDSLSA